MRGLPATRLSALPSRVLFDSPPGTESLGGSLQLRVGRALDAKTRGAGGREGGSACHARSRTPIGRESCQSSTTAPIGQFGPNFEAGKYSGRGFGLGGR